MDRFHAFLDLAPADAVVLIAAEEEIGPALADHWQDVCAAFHDDDAHNLYVPPDGDLRPRSTRAHVRLSSISGDQPVEFRAQAADVAARSLKDAEPELEKLVRGGYRTVVAWPRRGEGERAAYNLARLKARWIGEGEAGGNDLIEPELVFTDRARCATASSPPGIAGGHPRAPALPPQAGRAHRRAAAPPRASAAPCAPSPTCARATSSSTRTTASRASPASRRRPSRASPATT